MKCLACDGAEEALHGAEKTARLCNACDGTGKHNADANKACATRLGPCNCANRHHLGTSMVGAHHASHCRLYARWPKSEVELERERLLHDIAEMAQRLDLYLPVDVGMVDLWANAAVAWRQHEVAEAKAIEWMKSPDGLAAIRDSFDKMAPLPYAPPPMVMNWAWRV